ncbi:MAG TPA: CocE/NonD family hydrolase [Xanthobacteraceae bacterium]|nr:CocE/NonD family hydrolase [Xanthobacteraceae bacterium]
MALVVASAVHCAADPFVQEDLRIPLAAAGPRGLEALLVRPNEPGRYPLALMSHGSPRARADFADMTPLGLLPEAIEFARRGFAAVVVMRRGYGDSGGGWGEDAGGCTDPDYLAAERSAVVDLKATIDTITKRPDVDGSRMIAVGVSAGGLATVALTASPPPGLVAAISFAGGRGSLADNEVCRADRLIEAYRVLGKTSRVPMLWVYAANDHFFGPDLAVKFKDAFTGSGGRVDFVAAPAFSKDGHSLFSVAGIPVWTGYVDAFLKQQNLMLRATPLPPPPPPAIVAPAALRANGQAAFETYKISAPHKAFAFAPDGAFGWKTAMRTTEAARSAALKYCSEHASNCSVGFVDDAAVPK